MASPKIPVIITYQKPGTQPPLFVAGTFSDPQWEPIQMEFATDDDGEHIFKKEVAVAPGAQIQYKFRVGTGDWWVLDEGASIVTDEAGNRNNVLEAPSAKDSATESATTKSDELPSPKHNEDTKKKDNSQLASDIPVKSEDKTRTSTETDENPLMSAEVEGSQLNGIRADSALKQENDGDNVSHIPLGMEPKEVASKDEESDIIDLNNASPALVPVKEAETNAPDAKTKDIKPDDNTATETSSRPVAHQQDKQEHGSIAVEEKLPEAKDVQPKEEPGESDLPKPVANAAKEALSRREPSSGASTPSFVNIAAEVADSAALLDQEEKEPELSDAEAGKIGLRRLSSTPIPEVARTAAEVADSAQALDEEEVGPPRAQFQRICSQLFRSQPPFEYEPLPAAYDDFYEDEDVHGDHKPPLFSHECIGMDGDDGHEEIRGTEDELEDGGALERTNSGVEYDVDKVDLNDPTLEQFPSSRADIYSTVRKIETGLGEDHSVFEGVPPSPIVGSSRRGTDDILGDYYAASPVATSPVITRNHDRLRVSRSAHGSNSSLSLQSISEGDEPEPADDEDGSPQGLRPNLGKPKLKPLITPDSDEDEGVAMSFSDKTPRKNPAGETGLLTPEAAPSPKSFVPEIPPEPVPDISDPIPAAALPETSLDGGSAREEATKTPKTPKTILAESEENNSPRIVLEPAEETVPERPSSEDIEEPQPVSLASETEGTATSSNLIKRVVPGSQNGSRPGTPASMHSNNLQGGDTQGWFSAFFRVLFNWFGTFINRLYGGR
ncbi:hypothetical protein GQ53DRAFT_63173 [Thozetella sp. PMI_491]|nr:hypothetical protein GQ53DRAFT_63173 [Thozetella sp. PMI_491]